MKRYETIEELESAYIIKRRTINSLQKNYKGFKTKNYVVIKPISYFSYKSQTGASGYIVQNLDDQSYSIIPNVTIVRAYNDIYAKETHFGIRYAPCEAPFEITRDYVEKQMRSQKGKNRREHDFESMVQSALRVYDNNVAFFDSLSSDEFQSNLNSLVSEFGFKEISDARGIKNCLYILVFDKYKQYYIGSASDLANRTKKHWNAMMEIHRFGYVGGDRSKINVDTFRTKDNTRIFVLQDIDGLLAKYKYLDNPNLTITNTFAIYKYHEMTRLERAERIVINHSSCKYCLSDRIPLDATERTIGDWNKCHDAIEWNKAHVKLPTYNTTNKSGNGKIPQINKNKGEGSNFTSGYMIAMVFVVIIVIIIALLFI